jgi:hypothetical protein
MPCARARRAAPLASGSILAEPKSAEGADPRRGLVPKAWPLLLAPVRCTRTFDGTHPPVARPKSQRTGRNEGAAEPHLRCHPRCDSWRGPKRSDFPIRGWSDCVGELEREGVRTWRQGPPPRDERRERWPGKRAARLYRLSARRERIGPGVAPGAAHTVQYSPLRIDSCASGDVGRNGDLRRPARRGSLDPPWRSA